MPFRTNTGVAVMAVILCACTANALHLCNVAVHPFRRVPPVTCSSEDAAARLTQLKELLELGLITSEEYASKVQLDASPPPALAPQDELRAKLLTLVQRLPERGRLAVQADVPPFEVAAVLDVVGELEPLDPAARDGWMSCDAWDGEENGSVTPWVLRYTSSRLFHRNEGLTGYACKYFEVETPELRMTVDKPRRGWLTFEEPILRAGADAAAAGDSAIAECMWTTGGGDALKVTPQKMKADGREWSPRDPSGSDEVDMDAEKAVRVMAATRPVYLDNDLLIMRSAVLEETLFVWTRLGSPDPPAVEIDEADASSAADKLAAIMEARKSAGGSSRPRRSDNIPRYN